MCPWSAILLYVLHMCDIFVRICTVVLQVLVLYRGQYKKKKQTRTNHEPRTKTCVPDKTFLLLLYKLLCLPVSLLIPAPRGQYQNVNTI